jgi:hypothetical protein
MSKTSGEIVKSVFGERHFLSEVACSQRSKEDVYHYLCEVLLIAKTSGATGEYRTALAGMYGYFRTESLLWSNWLREQVDNRTGKLGELRDLRSFASMLCEVDREQDLSITRDVLAYLRHIGDEAAELGLCSSGYGNVLMNKASRGFSVIAA